MKAQIEIITLFRNTIEKSKQNAVSHEIETTTKLLATLEKGNTICIHNSYPFKEIIDDYDYLKIIEICKNSVKFEVENALSNIVEGNTLPVYLLNKKSLSIKDGTIIELPINQVLFIDDTLDNAYKTISVRVTKICK